MQVTVQSDAHLMMGVSTNGRHHRRRNVLDELGRPYCYVNCVEFDKSRHLLQALGNRLKVRVTLVLVLYRPALSTA